MNFLLKPFFLSEMCDQLKIELKWEPSGPTVPLEQLCRRGLEARACTCGSQLGMLLTCGKRASQKYLKMQSSEQGRGVREGRELLSNS